MVTIQTPLTVVSGGEVPAALTLSGLRVAVLTVAVTVARSALREAPEALQAVGTLAPCGPWNTLALTRRLVAERSDRAPWVTVTRSAARGAEQVRSRGTVLTVPANNVGSTPALTSTGLTHGAE